MAKFFLMLLVLGGAYMSVGCKASGEVDPKHGKMDVDVDKK